MSRLSQKQRVGIAALQTSLNCAQSVIKAFIPEMGIPEETALKIASGFGGGMRMGRTCGVITGSLMVLSMLYGYYREDDQEGKERTTQAIKQFLEDFKLHYCHCDCKELLGIDISIPGNREKASEQGLFKQHCPGLVMTAIALIEQRLQTDTK